jgi:uncharacterized protein (DUF1697 family)
MAKSRTQRYVAFLRAINVGGHTVKMDYLRQLFEALRFANVETFIASGNVVFDATATAARRLEEQIEKHLRKSLGYDVATFLRTPAELEAISRYAPFPPARLTPESTRYVGFLPKEPPAEKRQLVAALSTGADDLHVHGREVHWLTQGRMTDTSVNYALLEKTLALPATFRNLNTVNRLVAKLANGNGD